jgi:hypothetical protein
MIPSSVMATLRLCHSIFITRCSVVCVIECLCEELSPILPLLLFLLFPLPFPLLPPVSFFCWLGSNLISGFYEVGFWISVEMSSLFSEP